MSSLPLRLRILAAFLLSFALFVGAMGYAQLQLALLGEGLTVMNAGYLPLSRCAAEMGRLQDRIDLKLEHFDIAPARVDLETIALDESAQLDRRLQTGYRLVDQALALSKSDEERGVLTSLGGQLELIDEAYVTYAAAVERYVELSVRDDEAGLEAMEPDLREIQRQLRTEIEQLSGKADASITRVSTRTSFAQRRAVAVSGGLALGSLALGAVMMSFAAASLRPIGRMTDEVQRIARGDYAARVEIVRRDELGVLASEVNAMARSIQQRDEDLRARARELEQARARLRSVLDAIRLGLIVVNGDRVATVNPAAVALWGVEPGGPLPAALDFAGERADALEIDGRRYDLRRAPFGGGFILVGEDVTQRLRDRDRLARSERLALIGQMLAQITHEVRNPLNALSLNVELLTEDLEALPPERIDEASTILNTVTSEIRRLEDTTEHYLDLARLQRAHPEPEEPAALLEGVGRFLEAELRQMGVELTVDAPRGGAVMMDGNQMRRALINVVRNAAEAGAGQIALRIERGDDELRICVDDDGEGLDPSVADSAFEPFVSTKARGTGLGLAITRQILEAHGGTVRIAPGSPGTKLRLVLPLEA